MKSETDWARLRRMRDEDIVIDDENPEWTKEDFAKAVVRVGLKPVPRKSLLSLRLDTDVIEWFRAQGPGYQSRMNALLRAFMEASKTAAVLDSVRAAKARHRVTRGRSSSR